MSKLKDLEMLRDKLRWASATWTNDLIEVGDFTYGRPIVLQWDKTTRLKIGKFCSIAGNIKIMLGGEHHTDRITTYPFDVLLDNQPTQSNGDVIIGNDVWIGENVTILSGVTIGDGAVIGAGSVVARDVLPYTIVCGAPAKLKKVRDCWPEIQGVAWWNWPLEKIAAGYDLILSNDTDGLIKFDKDWR